MALVPSQHLSDKPASITLRTAIFHALRSLGAVSLHRWRRSDNSNDMANSRQCDDGREKNLHVGVLSKAVYVQTRRIWSGGECSIFRRLSAFLYISYSLLRIKTSAYFWPEYFTQILEAPTAPSLTRSGRATGQMHQN
jgi:hypothetical protein